MDSILQLHEDEMEDPGAATGLIELATSRSTPKPDCPLSREEDVFAPVDDVLPDDDVSAPIWGTSMQVKALPDSFVLSPAPPAYYRTASWPATSLPHPPMLTALSVPPPPLSPGLPVSYRRASLPILEQQTDSLDNSVYGSTDVHSLLQQNSADSSPSRPRAASSEADPLDAKVPLSNIAAMMTGINMAKVVIEVGKSTKAPLKDPPRSKSSISKSARERMLQQNRMAQAKYRERQKERALHMASELATKRQQNASLMAAIEDRDATIAMLRAQLASAEAGALVHVRDLLDTQQLWVPLEPGGLGVAPPGLHVLLQGTSPPLTDINATVHAAVVAHLHFSLQRGMQLMQPPAAASLLVSWQPVLHQLQLTAAQHTIVVSLTRNALERLHILQHKRACMAQEINAACISALTASNGVDKTHVTMNMVGESRHSLLLLDSVAMPVLPACEPRVVQLLQSMESARLLVIGYPDKSDAVQLGLVLMALPSPGNLQIDAE